MRTCRTCAYARYNPLIGEYRCTLTNMVMTKVDEFDCESYRKGRPCGPPPPPRAAITTNDHTRLRNRNAADQHSIGSIHGLQDALDSKLSIEALEKGVEKALAEAKESRKFDGAPGKDGVTPSIGQNGNWFVGETDTGVPANGQPGKDGTTPHIGENGNWWIGDQDTGKPSRGEAGSGGSIEIETLDADKVIFQDDMVFTEPFGKYRLSGGKVRVPSGGKSVRAMFLDAFSEDKNPTITQPSIGINSSTAKAYEVGTSVNPTYAVSFNVGKYEYGPATGVDVSKWEVSNNATSETRTTNSATFAAYTVPDGSNYKITVAATYTDGAIPLTALEAEYPAGQIKGATKTVTSGAITGYRNSFYGTLTDKTTAVTSDVVRALPQRSGKALANGNSFTVNVPIGAESVLIAYPATLRDITSIKDVNGLNADITSAFTKSTLDVAGANGYTAISYKLYRLDFAKANDTANKYTVTI